MTCPLPEELTLLSMGVLDESEAEQMHRHLESCADCRARFQESRRGHVELMRTYEAMDHDHDALREQLMAGLPAGEPQPVSAGWAARRWRRLGDIAMNSPTTRRAAGLLSAAAIIVIVCSFFWSHGNGTAFATVIERLQQTKTVVCRLTTEITGGTMELTTKGKLHLSADHGVRVDLMMGGQSPIIHYHPLDGPAIVVVPPTKTYMVMEVPDDAEHAPESRQPDGLVRQLLELTDDASESLGSEVLEGRQVEGFAIAGHTLGLDDATAAARLYVDTQTWLPVRYVVEMPGPEAGSRLTVVHDQFEWDVPLEAMLFEPQIPEDYTAVDLKLPAKSEETLLEGLQVYATLADGTYPSSLDPVRLPGELVAIFAKRKAASEAKLDSGSPAFKELSQKLMVVVAAGNFYQQLVREGHEPEYFGEEVTADDADAVLLRWHQDDEYDRVVYGDLRIATVPRAN